MQSEQIAEKNAAYAPMYWVMVYIWCGVFFLGRLGLFCAALRGQSADVLWIVERGLQLLYLILPLLLGRAFKRQLKRELEKGSLSEHAFTTCDWRIAQLLLIAYMGMVVFSFRS